MKDRETEHTFELGISDSYPSDPYLNASRLLLIPICRVSCSSNQTPFDRNKSRNIRSYLFANGKGRHTAFWSEIGSQWKPKNKRTNEEEAEEYGNAKLFHSRNKKKKGRVRKEGLRRRMEVLATPSPRSRGRRKHMEEEEEEENVFPTFLCVWCLVC